MLLIEYALFSPPIPNISTIYYPLCFTNNVRLMFYVLKEFIPMAKYQTKSITFKFSR